MSCISSTYLFKWYRIFLHVVSKEDTGLDGHVALLEMLGCHVELPHWAEITENVLKYRTYLLLCKFQTLGLPGTMRAIVSDQRNWLQILQDLTLCGQLTVRHLFWRWIDQKQGILKNRLIWWILIPGHLFRSPFHALLEVAECCPLLHWLGTRSIWAHARFQSTQCSQVLPRAGNRKS